MNSGARAGVLGRVVVLESVDRSGEIVEALRAHGFRVDVAADINCVASLVTFDEYFVVVADASQPRWVRGVSDLVSVRCGARTLVLAGVRGPDEILAALNAGVAGFVSPNADTDAIARSVHSIFDSGVAIPRGMVPALVAAVTFARGHSLEDAGGTDRSHRPRVGHPAALDAATYNPRDSPGAIRVGRYRSEPRQCPPQEDGCPRS